MQIEGLEQNGIKPEIKHLFSLQNESKCLLREFSERNIFLQLNFKNISQQRKIEIFDDRVVIDDYSNLPFRGKFDIPNEFSNGYGKLTVKNR